jgi:hypothetical protein|tara:strand:+ start:677 stop:952 length:276 start_codon:yes stop_codon:yes gene_type:complete
MEHKRCRIFDCHEKTFDKDLCGNHLDSSKKNDYKGGDIMKTYTVTHREEFMITVMANSKEEAIQIAIDTNSWEVYESLDLSFTTVVLEENQ